MNLYNMKSYPKKRLLLLILLLSVFGLGLLVLQISRFHLVSTTPRLKSVTVITNSISFNYNSRLSSTGVSVSSDEKIVKSFSVDDKSLLVSLNSNNLSVGKTYSITVGPIQDTKNKSISAKTYKFRVVSVSFSELSKSQQAAVMKQQENVPYTRSSINYAGFDTLARSGLSATQLEDTKQAFFLYSNQINKKLSQITIVAGSASQAPYDSNSTSQTSSVSFSVEIDGTAFSAKLVYSGLSDVELYLYSQGSVLIYDSGNITPASY